MKRELTTIKERLADLAAFRTEVRQEFKRLHETDRKIAASVVRLEAKVDGFADVVARSIAKALEPIHEKLDSVARLAEDARYRWAVHADTLLEHDRRLKKLESRQ